MAGSEADRYRDRSGTTSGGAPAPTTPQVPQSDMAANEAAFGAQDGGAAVDYNDPMQNYGIAEAQRNSWDADIYIDEVWSRRDVPDADFAMLSTASGGANSWLYDKEMSGFNDPESISGFNKWGEATENVGRDAYFFYQRAPQARRAYLQKLLFDAGLVDHAPKGGAGSILDQDYLDAWKLAVETSQRSGIPLYALLEQEAAALEASGGRGGGGGGGGAGPRRPTAQIISEDDAREVVDQVAKQELGRKLTDEEESLASGIVSAIRSKMSVEANAMIDQQMAGGGTASQPTNPQVTAKEEVESRLEGESTAYDLAQAFAHLLGMTGA